MTRFNPIVQEPAHLCARSEGGSVPSQATARKLEKKEYNVNIVFILKVSETLVKQIHRLNILIWYIIFLVQFILSLVWFCVTYKTGFWIGWLHLIRSQLGTRGNYSAISVLHILQFTVPHALWFSVFTSRLLATDLSQSHCNFKLHMKSSLHRLVPSLLLFCDCQFRGLDWIQFLCSQAHILAGWRLGTRLDSTRLLGLYSVPSSDCVLL
jgi:hypothetical protein